jgi:type IV pilus assembly protein PilB
VRDELKLLLAALKDEVVKICLDAKLLSDETLITVAKQSKNSGISALELIMKDGLLEERAALEIMRDRYGIKIADNPEIRLSGETLPTSYFKKNGLIPLALEGEVITAAVAAPSALNSLKNVSLLAGKKITPVLVGINWFEENLLGAQSRNVSGNLLPKVGDSHTSLSNGQPSEKSSEVMVTSNLLTANKVTKELLGNALEKMTPSSVPKQAVRVDQPKRNQSPKEKISENSNVINVVEEVLSFSVDSGVSDIHIEIFRDTANLRVRRNGTLLELDKYRKYFSDNYSAIIARIKILANLDIAEKRLPQDGKISFRSRGGKEVDFRVSVLPTNLGERIVIRILSAENLAVSIDKLGFADYQEKDFLEAIESPQGMVLVTGPTGSGKSTTLYGAISHLNNPGVNILTAEDPVEYTLSGIGQVQIRENIGLTFASALRSFLRQDPEIILVGEIRDLETADISTKAALTGHLVLSTLHTNSAIGAITRLVNMGLPSYLVSSALTLVVGQRLVRENCSSCSESIDAEEALLSLEPYLARLIRTSLTFKEGVLKKGKGCTACNNTGYAGRRAIHEVLKITVDLQHAINKSASENEMVAIAHAEGFRPMSIVAINHILSGNLSIEEYLRVIPRSEDFEK